MSCTQNIKTDQDNLFFLYLDNCVQQRVYPPLRLYDLEDFIIIRGKDAREISISKSTFDAILNGSSYSDKNEFIPDMLIEIAKVNATAGCCSPAGTIPVSTKTAMFVTEGGDDTKALNAGKYDWVNHWRNPTVAMANAVPGDTVFVFGHHKIGAGELVEDDGLQYVVRNGVKLVNYGTIEFTNLTGTFSLPFYDNGNAEEFVVRGGNFIFNINTSGGSDLLCATNSGTVVDWQVDSIDIRRRWGGIGHDCLSWKMEGKNYLNRESQLYLFQYPNIATTQDRYFKWKFDTTIIDEEGAVTNWIRAQLRNWGDNSTADIDYGFVAYPRASNFQCFHSNIQTSANSTININANYINRTDTISTISDYLINRINDRSRGLVSFKGISTITGLMSASFGLTASTVKRKTYFEGQIRDGAVPGGSVQFLGSVASLEVNDQIELQIQSEQLSAGYNGFNVQDCPNVTISGRVVWLHASNPTFRLNSGAGVTCLMERLTISRLKAGVVPVDNINVVPANLHVIACYATRAVGAGGGGINEPIESFNTNLLI